MDALTDGKMYDNAWGWGHGAKYYNRKYAVEAEVFANMFTGYSTGGNMWKTVQEYFPNTSKLFAEIVEKEIK